MIYRKMGNSGLKVSLISLGTLNFGRNDFGCDEKSSIEITNNFLEAGGNTIDTADMYANGESEKIVGKAIKGKRDDIVLIGKGCNPNQDNTRMRDINYRGSSRINIINALENSLKRLNTDYFDLYCVHFWDPTTPFEETMNVLTDLVRSGKARYVGASNFTGWQISEAASIWKNDKRIEPFISLQAQYNIVERDIELEVIPSCIYNNIGIVCWSPTAGGLLAGIYNKDGIGPSDERFTPTNSNKKADIYNYMDKKNLEIAEEVKKMAKELDTKPAILSMKWLVDRPKVTSILAGPRNLEHLSDALNVENLKVPESYFEKLDEMSEPKKHYPYIIQDYSFKNFYKGFEVMGKKVE